MSSPQRCRSTRKLRQEALPERVLGPYRENAFYRLPIPACLEKSDLLIDFARNRSGFKLIQFPEEVNVDFIVKDPDHAAAQPVSKDVIKSVVLREYGVNLSRLNP
ncbi:MAG TPA: hypothetical protein VJS37_09220 [Terriglobales bacterium]|nr:hypothetical protein [Terriglobales bacterium]